MAENAEWEAYRKGAALDSSLLREKGVTPAWSLGGAPRGQPCLVGEQRSKETFSPERPPHARNETPYHVEQYSSVGRQVQSEKEHRLESQPAFNFYGPYGDSWSQEKIDALKGDRGSKAHGLFAAALSAGPGVGGTTVRAPAKVPGPGHYIARADAAFAQACGRQVLSTKPTAARTVVAAHSLDDKQRAALAAHAAAHAPPGGLSWPDRGPTAATASGSKVTNSTIGVRHPTSSLANAPTFTFTDKPKFRVNTNPGPGGGGVVAVPGNRALADAVGAARAFEGAWHVIGAVKQRGDPDGHHAPLATDTTLGRGFTRPSAPVAVMPTREPKHAARAAKAPEVVSGKDDYRAHPNRWTSRVAYELKGVPTEARGAVYSSFGGQKGSVQRSAAAYTMRALHVNQSKKINE